MGLTLAKLIRVLAVTVIGSVLVHLWGLGGFLLYQVLGVFVVELYLWWCSTPPCHFCGNVADGYSLTCDGCRSRLREPR